jgi:hypothetical protein
MQTPSIRYFLLFLVIAWFGTGCASFTGFSTGRTVGKGKVELEGSLSLIETPDLIVKDTVTVIPTLRIPLVELGGRYGIAKKFDVGLRVNTSANFILDGKYQFIGDQESIFAAAIGAEIGIIPLTAISITIVNFHVPLYLSIHPTEKIHIYASPRYVYQYGSTISQFIGNANYTGFNAGVLFGRDFKFGIDVSNYRISGKGGKLGREYDKPNLLSFGIGMQVTF